MMKKHVSTRPHSITPLLLGRGKLAQHLHHYFELKQIPHLRWEDSRTLNSEFLTLSQKADAIWVLVSDQAIDEVIKNCEAICKDKIYIHSSAANSYSKAFTAHPLQTFSPSLYSLEDYEVIPFNFIEEEWKDAPLSLKNFFEVLNHPKLIIPAKNRTLYHAYSSMIANFPQILWGSIFQDMRNETNFNPELFKPLLAQATSNFLLLEDRALTGPLVRNDVKTIEKHKLALKSSPLHSIYENFVSLYQSFFRRSS